MSRTCYVLMPFSGTESCTRNEWTRIFEELLRPAVEEAGQGYQCVRSTATRGNIVASILQDINDSYVVIADLTDQNANVFYELGVRHSLKNRTIMIAQKRNHIPFDLEAYAYHIYDWRTKKGRQLLVKKIRQLLAEVDANPERPDNPVSDFLRRSPNVKAESYPVTIAPSYIVVAKPLAGPSAEGLNVIEFVRDLLRRGQPHDAETVLRLTRGEQLPLISHVVESLNMIDPSNLVGRGAMIITEAQQFISRLDPIIQRVEEFALASIQEHWEPGIQLALKLSGDWISISERIPYGQVIHYAQGSPALMAWRMLSLCGAKALDQEAFGFLHVILKEPIEVEASNGTFSNRPFVDSRYLFYPDAFLGYADFAMNYIDGIWSNHEHLHSFFSSNDSYQLAIARFFIVVSLAMSADERHKPIYHGYNVLRQARRAMSQLCRRMSASQPYLDAVAKAMGESGTHLAKTWSKRVQLINNVDTLSWLPQTEIGAPHLLPDIEVRFPDPMSAEIP